MVPYTLIRSQRKTVAIHITKDAVVEGVLPDYREQKKRLKSLQDKLSHEDWE